MKISGARYASQARGRWGCLLLLIGAYISIIVDMLPHDCRKHEPKRCCCEPVGVSQPRGATIMAPRGHVYSNPLHIWAL